MTDDAEQIDELRVAAAHGLRWSSISRPTTEVLLLGSMVVLARLISPAEFGRYAVALIIQELAFNIPSEGVGTALVQRRTVGREHLQAGMALALLIGVSLAGVTLVAASLIVAPIFGARTALFVQLSTPLCIVSAISAVPAAIMYRRMAFRRLSEIEVVSAVIRAATCIGLALAGLGGEALIFGTLAGTGAVTIILLVSAPPPLPRLRREPARDIMHFGLPASLAAVSWAGFRNCDYAIIGARLGAFPAGLYFRSYTLAIDYQKKMSMVMGQVGFPVLARTKNAAELGELRRKMVRLLTILIFPLLALLAILAPVLIPFLFGPAWVGATVPTQILALGGAATLVIDAVGTVLMATGRARALLGYGVAHCMAYALTVLVVVQFGIVAVAIDAAVVHTLFLLVAYALMLRGSDECPLRCLWDDVAPATIACIGLAAVALPVSLGLSSVRPPAIVQLAAVGLIAVPAYLLTLRVCSRGAWRDLLVAVRRILPERSLRMARPFRQADARPAA
jgi:lipopolysaccharide exporter